MEGNTGWVQQRQSGIGFNELSSMVAELVAHFEANQSFENEHAPDWISPSSRTRVIRHGSSSCLFSVLNQVPSAISSEYVVLYKGLQVFSWSEYKWAHLHQSEEHDNDSRVVYLLQSCLNELMAFHVQNKTHWLKRYQAKLQRDRAVEINKISIMAQPNCIELS